MRERGKRYGRRVKMSSIDEKPKNIRSTYNPQIKTKNTQQIKIGTYRSNNARMF